MAPHATNTAPTRVLLIDGGQSGCRGRYVDGLAATSRGPDVCGPGVPRRGRDWSVLRSLVVGEVDLVVAGLTGFDGDAAAVARAVGTRVIVTNDAVTAYLGALGAQPGVVIVAGTGVIALAVGRGRPLGARRRLGLAARRRRRRLLDRPPRPRARAARPRRPRRLARAAAARREPFRRAARPRDLRRSRPGGGDRRRSRRTSPTPPAPATSSPSAIWTDAARELAATATAALASLDGNRPARSPDGDGPASCSYAGGLFAAGELLLAPLRAELPGLRTPLGSPLDGAARLLERPPLFQDLIVEAGAP